MSLPALLAVDDLPGVGYLMSVEHDGGRLTGFSCRDRYQTHAMAA